MSEGRRSQTEALLLDYWYVLKKRKIVVMAFTGFLLVTVAIATATATRYYSSTAIVEISPKAPEVLELDEVSEFVSARSTQELRNYYATQYKIIQSRSVLEATVKKLREDHGITDFDALEKPTEFLGKHMLLEPIVETHLVKMTFEYPDREKAALFANTMAETYIEFNLERALGASKQALSWLEQQHDVYRELKFKSDSAVHKYKHENELAGVDERYNTTIETLSKLQSSWAEAHAERIEVEAVYKELTALSKEENWSPLANHLAGTSAALKDLLSRFDKLQQDRSRLATRYKEAHPEMTRVDSEMAAVEKQITEEIGDIVAGRRAEFEVVERKERALKKELDLIRDEVEGLDGRLIELKFLESEEERNEQFYKSLDVRMSEVDLSQVLRANNVRVIDPAIPGDTPVRPKLPVNLAMGLVLGIFGGCAMAFFMEYLDVTVKTREDIEQVIGIPMLGVVPVVETEDLRVLKDDVDRSVFVHARPRSTVSECMRSIRTNVMFRIPQKKVRTLLVTSAAPREGKSFTSVNLAAIIAMTGSRVLIIDADLRRPALHKRFGLPNEVGLCALFNGEATFEQAVQHSHVPGLDVLVAGPPPPNPGELLGGGFMKQLLASLRDYDVLLVDSPPVNVVADPLVLSGLADGVIMVVEANRTSRNVVVQAHARLAEMKANMLGAIVNKLNIRTAGYGYYYYDTYGYYYTEAEQTREQKTVS